MVEDENDKDTRVANDMEWEEEVVTSMENERKVDDR